MKELKVEVKIPSHVPDEWGQPGAGGIFAFQQDFITQKKKELGEEFVFKVQVENSSKAWKEKDSKFKWQKYGQIPVIPPAHLMPIKKKKYVKKPEIIPATVTRWIDHSSKYGVAYLLTNGRMGVLFNDGTTIVD